MESKAGYFFVAQISGPRILGSMAFNFSMGVTEGPEVASVQRVVVGVGWKLVWGFPKMVGFPNNHGFSY